MENAEKPPVRLLPEDMRMAYIDVFYRETLDAQGKAQYDRANPVTVYNAPPMVRFIPDRTYGQMAFLFVIELKNGALKKWGQPAWLNESDAILNSYIDILGAVVRSNC